MITQGFIRQESRRKKILDLGLSVLPHPSYSPDLQPSDFHLFYSPQNVLNDKNFLQKDQVKMFMENFFSSKPSGFYLRGINKLPDQVQEVIQNNDKYDINRN